MKKSFYFSHDHGARNDPKLQSVLMEHGCEGIGVYWCIVEQLYEQDGVLPLSVCKSIAFALHVDSAVVESLVKNFKLFDFDEDNFWSKSVNNRRKKSDEVSDKRREAARKKWGKGEDNAKGAQSDANAEQKDANAEQKDIILMQNDAIIIKDKVVYNNILKDNILKESSSVVDNAKLREFCNTDHYLPTTATVLNLNIKNKDGTVVDITTSELFKSIFKNLIYWTYEHAHQTLQFSQFPTYYQLYQCWFEAHKSDRTDELFKTVLKEMNNKVNLTEKYASFYDTFMLFLEQKRKQMRR